MKKKENIIIIVVLVVMILAIVGVSYAAFSYGKTGSKVNSITTGSITMTYEETDNTISLSGALPTTDKTGTVRLNPGEYFDFSISSEITGDVNINYEISAKKEDANTIDGEYIKLYLTRLTDDGEEQLMTPETYNEESSTNTYTGRPSGEMSLYTSSMNSSESNNYRLRMYVTEEYNPQGDGGGLQFSVQINVYGKAGDKYVPLTTQKILEDNELQEEKANMFNYTNNGDIITDSHEVTVENHPEYVTNGLYSAEDEDGISYYYRGAVTNNNVQFGEYTEDYYVYMEERGSFLYQGFQTLKSCEDNINISRYTCKQVKLASAGDKMYWKIVRVNGDGSLRLIYNGTSVNPTNSDLANSYAVGQVPYNPENDDPKYAGYTYDNGTDSFIKKEVDTWYKNALGSSSYDSKVIGGRFCSDSSGYKNAEEYGFLDDDWYTAGDKLFVAQDRLGQFITNFSKSNSPTLKCPSTSESYGGSYRLKVGLITADELAFAGSSHKVRDNNMYLLNSSKNLSFASMTPSAFAGSQAQTFLYNFGLGDTSVITSTYLRPVINVTTENGFTSGDGTSENPYIIQAE